MLPQGVRPIATTQVWPWRLIAMAAVVACLLLWRQHQPRHPNRWVSYPRSVAAPSRHIIIGHVEAMPGQYLPRLDAARFGGVQFEILSGSARYSGHADATCRLLYGPRGLAPTVRHVKLFESFDWMGPRCLRSGSFEPPTAVECRVFTHSWILDIPSEPTLARLDWLIDREGVIVVTGVDNGGNSSVPALPASAYNAIAVGLPGRRSSTGYTKAAGPGMAGAGRCKPELVVDMPRTSFAAPVVAAAAAQLLQVTDHLASQHKPLAETSLSPAVRPQLIKALLMAGADKSCGFNPEPGKPLDPHHGAGLLNLNRSMEILGVYVPASEGPVATDRPMGWDGQAMKPMGEAAYDWVITRPVKNWTIALAWHRRVDAITATHEQTGERRWLLDSARLADFNLRLIAFDGGDVRILARSTSGVDNIEHLFVKELPPGRYRIDVRRQDDDRTDWPYAVASWSE
jgi:hypothetical protein